MPKNQRSREKGQQGKPDEVRHLGHQNMHQIEGEGLSRGNPRTDRSTGLSYRRPSCDYTNVLNGHLNITGGYTYFTWRLIPQLGDIKRDLKSFGIKENRTTHRLHRTT